LPLAPGASYKDALAEVKGHVQHAFLRSSSRTLHRLAEIERGTPVSRGLFRESVGKKPFSDGGLTEEGNGVLIFFLAN